MKIDIDHINDLAQKLGRKETIVKFIQLAEFKNGKWTITLEDLKEIEQWAK